MPFIKTNFASDWGWIIGVNPYKVGDVKCIKASNVIGRKEGKRRSNKKMRKKAFIMKA